MTATAGTGSRGEAAGLSSAEVETRRAAGGGNDYQTPTSRTYVEIVRDNSYPFINGPLLLVSAALVSFGALTEALMTGLPVVGNIAIGVVQGSRAKRQLDRVALLSEAPAIVVRDGTEQTIPPAQVVLGDVVIANRGDEIQLDGRLVGEATASIDESALTGESHAVDKASGDEVLSGSAVLSGTARYVVEAVGAQTFANRILARAKGTATSGHRSRPISPGRSLPSRSSSFCQGPSCSCRSTPRQSTPPTRRCSPRPFWSLSCRRASPSC